MAGIGGLLLLDRSTTPQWVVGSDGRGNVTTLLDALATDTGTPANNLKAGIEYTPYGEVVRSQGSFTEVPFRFQSKWALGQAWEGSWSVEFLDFGRRMYPPSLGRFLSRDPVGEAAGANLYHYCGNDPINGMDPLGLEQRASQRELYGDQNGIVDVTWTAPSSIPSSQVPPAPPGAGTWTAYGKSTDGGTTWTWSPWHLRPADTGSLFSNLGAGGGLSLLSGGFNGGSSGNNLKIDPPASKEKDCNALAALLKASIAAGLGYNEPTPLTVGTAKALGLHKADKQEPGPRPSPREPDWLWAPASRMGPPRWGFRGGCRFQAKATGTDSTT